MLTDHWLAFALGGALAAYALFVLALLLAGRREAARAIAGFIPDCVVLFRRLLADGRLPRRVKVLLAISVGYLAMPFDVVPDFVPIAGQLDDAVVVMVALRLVLSAAGPGLVEEHWPGPPSSLGVIMRLAGQTDRD
jgi:uncharacterized membrane protein YkvA (DUF1232 family)